MDNKFSYQQPIMFGGGWDDARRGPPEVQILRAGEFDSAQGTFEVTPDDLVQMAMNFSTNARRIDICINEGHDVGGAALAWIKKVYTINSDTELWASVAWTDEGNKKVGSKEYKYLSSEFADEYTDNESGENHGMVLLGAACTNWPVVKAMNPLFLSEKNNKGATNMIPKKDKSAEELEGKFSELQANFTTLSESVKAKDTVIEKLTNDMKALSESNETLKAEKALVEKNSEFDKLMSEGKACEAQRQAFLKNDMVEFVKNAEKANFKSTSSSHTPPAKTEVDIETQIITLASEKSKATNKTLSESIGDVLRENPELAKKYNEKFQTV